MFREGTWDEVNPQAIGQNNSSFEKQKDAEKVFEAVSKLDLEPDVAKIYQKIEDKKKNLQEDQAMIFTDGSYKDVKPEKYGAGWGYLRLTKRNGKIHEDNDHGYILGSNSRQVNGEIEAIEEGLDEFELDGIKKVDIYCDFLNLMMWVTVFYSADTDASKEFVEFINKSRNKFDITFHRCPAHEGIPDNETVDAKAKKGFDEAPTEDDLREQASDIEDRMEEIRENSSAQYYSYDNAGSVIGDTGRLTDDQDSYDAAIDEYTDREEADEYDELEHRLNEITKLLDEIDEKEG